MTPWVVAFASAAMTTMTRASIVNYFDSAFNSGDWTSSIILDTSYNRSGSQVTYQDTANGDPSPGQTSHLFWDYNGNGHSQGIVVGVLKNNAIFYPQVQGEIKTIDFSSNIKLIENINGGQGISIHPLVLQDGQYFLGPDITTTSTSWVPVVMNNLLASDFTNLMTGATPSFPDFSATASSLQFGYTASSAGAKGDAHKLVSVEGVDNVATTVFSGAAATPEPSVILPAISITWSFLCRRRR